VSENCATTAITNIFSGRPARVISNRLVREIGPMAAGAPEFPRAFSAHFPLKTTAEDKGSTDFSNHYSGQAASLGSPTTARELTQSLVEGAGKCFSTLS
jgi:nitronate monooxygenase